MLISYLFEKIVKDYAGYPYDSKFYKIMQICINILFLITRDYLIRRIIEIIFNPINNGQTRF